LTGLSLNLKVCQTTLPPGSEQARKHLTKASALVNQTMEQAHRMIAGLHPSILDDNGLLPALQEELHQRLDPLGVQVQIETHGAITGLPPDLATTAFRITQEAVTNIIRHAQARAVCVDLECTESGFIAKITDDGVGLKAKAVTSSAHAPILSPGGLDGTHGQTMRSRRSLGIVGMQERATAMGGWLQVRPRQPHGAEVYFWLPHPQTPPTMKVTLCI
jgi:signal transduction histidine kinase